MKEEAAEILSQRHRHGQEFLQNAGGVASALRREEGRPAGWGGAEPEGHTRGEAVDMGRPGQEALQDSTCDPFQLQRR